MDKKSFINMFQQEDKILISNLFEKIVLANKTGNTIYCCDFYTPNVWSKLLNLQIELGVNIKTFGLFDAAERRMLAFSVEEASTFPVQFLCIKNKSKFSALKHKDYLGALMSLGIKREKFGDIVLAEDRCYLPVCEEVSGYVLSNLIMVGNSPCKVELLDSLDVDFVKPSYEENTIITSSLRIDCFVSSLCKVSRNQAVDLLKSGKVQLDYSIVEAKEKKIMVDSILVVRGYGKFKLVEVMGTTQKDRIKVLVKKYI